MSCGFSSTCLRSDDQGDGGMNVDLHLLRVEKYLSGEREDSARKVPLLFVASPSAKDPTWEERSPGNRPGRDLPRLLQRIFTAVFLRKVHPESGHLRQLQVVRGVEGGQSDQPRSRVQGAEAGLHGLHPGGGPGRLPQDHPREGTVCPRPAAAPDTGFHALLPVWPLQIEYMDAGTPITNTHYIGAPRGEIYGADHGTARFSPELNATVRPQTPLRNLYLTGRWSARRRPPPRPGVTLCCVGPQVRTPFCAASPAPWPARSPVARSSSTATFTWTPSAWPREPNRRAAG